MAHLDVFDISEALEGSKEKLPFGGPIWRKKSKYITIDDHIV